MSVRNQFPNRGATTTAREWFAVTPSDDDDLEQMPKGLWVGTGGDLAIMGIDGNVEVMKNVPNGFMLVVGPVRVMEATTASDILAMV